MVTHPLPGRRHSPHFQWVQEVAPLFLRLLLGPGPLPVEGRALSLSKEATSLEFQLVNLEA
jgi:hypothetical protein